jgi:hypothetical protein
MPKKNYATITNFKPNEALRNLSKFQELLPAPRTRLRDRNLPQTLSLQPISFNLSHPKRIGFCEQIPNMI